MGNLIRQTGLACLAIALAALLLLGCGSGNSVEKFNQVKTGWTKEQVEQLLGKPDAMQNAGLGLAEVWEYKATDWKGKVVSTFTVAMIGGRVVTGTLQAGAQN